MPKVLLVFSLLIWSIVAGAQQLSIPELQKLAALEHFRVDTILKKKGYILMQKDVDSTSAIYQYSHIDHKEEKDDKPTNVRSVQYMDVNTSRYSSRLFTYRTYDKDEFRDMSIYLLGHNYKCTDKYNFQGAENLVYNNGTQTIRVKILTIPMKDGRRFTAYELELGN